jgi:alpha-tubulin suppressor-like RCC1 family protein
MTGVLLNKVIISVKAKGDFTIVLSDDGIVFGWGSNTNYQLADGTTVTRTSPIKAIGTILTIPGQTPSQDQNVKITHIAAGRSHVIAYSSVTGYFYSWGQNNVGQLGIQIFY